MKIEGEDGKEERERGTCKYTTLHNIFINYNRSLRTFKLQTTPRQFSKHRATTHHKSLFTFLLQYFVLANSLPL